MILTTALRVSAPLSKEHWTQFFFGIVKKKLIWIWGPTAANQGNDASMKAWGAWGRPVRWLLLLFFLSKWLVFLSTAFLSASFINASFYTIFKCPHSPGISLFFIFALNTLSPPALIHTHGFNYYLSSKSFKCMHTAQILLGAQEMHV